MSKIFQKNSLGGGALKAVFVLRYAPRQAWGLKYYCLSLSKAYIILVFAALAFSPALAQELPPPIIAINPDVYYPLDEILYMEGRARATSTIQIQFQKQGAKPVTVNTRSDANGEWVLAEKVPLDAGDWEVRARVAESSGRTSEWSNPRVIKAVQTGIVIGGVTVKFAVLIFALLLVLLIGVVLVIYFSWRVRRLKARVTYLRTRELEKELAQKSAALERALLEKGREVASTVVEEGFEELRQSILGEIEHLEKRADGRPLTAEEEEHKKLLLAKLKEIEEKIERKIREVRV